MINPKIKKLINPRKLLTFGILSVIIYLCVVAFTAYNLYNKTFTLLKDQLRKEVLGIAMHESLRIDSSKIETLNVKEDFNKQDYKDIVLQLKEIKDSRSDIAYAYILKIDPENPNQVLQPADADSINPFANIDDDKTNDVDINKDGKIEPYGADELIYPGFVYEDAPIENIKNAYKEAYVDSDFYKDSWGRFISAYAPIKNENKETVALLALDIRDTEVLGLQQKVIKPFIFTVSILCLSVLILAYLLLEIWGRQYKHAVELDGKKDMLISMIGHELQTPLATIRWVLSDILSSPKESMSPEVRTMVEDAHTETVNAADLAKTILHVSRSELGKLDLNFIKTNLAPIVDGIVSEFKIFIEEKQINLNVDVDNNIAAEVDPHYIAVALKNLISNAVKYTPRGKSISISAKQDEFHVHVEVKDTGIGIPEVDRSKLLTIFARATNTKLVSGHGLGLYLTNKIIEAHHGDLGFESKLDEGTTFRVTLPLSQNA